MVSSSTVVRMMNLINQVYKNTYINPNDKDQVNTWTIVLNKGVDISDEQAIKGCLNAIEREEKQPALATIKKYCLELIDQDLIGIEGAWSLVLNNIHAYGTCIYDEGKISEGYLKLPDNVKKAVDAMGGWKYLGSANIETNGTVLFAQFRDCLKAVNTRIEKEMRINPNYNANYSLENEQEEQKTIGDIESVSDVLMNSKDDSTEYGIKLMKQVKELIRDRKPQNEPQ